MGEAVHPPPPTLWFGSIVLISVREEDTFSWLLLIKMLVISFSGFSLHNFLFPPPLPHLDSLKQSHCSKLAL
jgi:hypothetical protein